MLRLILLALFIVIPVLAQTPETASCLGTTTNCTTGCTLSGHTLTDDPNRIVVALLRLDPVATGVLNPSCTYGGNAMTAVNLGTCDSSNPECVAAFYILEASLPANGARDLVCDSAAELNSWHATVVQVNGAKQEAPHQVGVMERTAAQTSTPVALTSLEIGSLVGFINATTADRQGEMTLGGGLSTWCSAGAGAGDHDRGDSGFLTADNSSETPTATWTTSTTAAAMAFGLAPAPAASPVEYSSAGVFFKRKGSRGPFRIQPLTLTDAEEETAYTGATPLVQSGQTPFTWAVVGSLPTGLSISSTTGVISGTPDSTSAGTYPFTVKVTDDDGGVAFLDVSLTVQDSGGDTLAFYEDCEDGNLTADPTWTTAGGSSCSANGFMEGNDEITKTTSTDSVLVDNINAPVVFFGFDIYRNGAALPDTNRDRVILGLGASDEFLFSCRVEIDFDLWCKTAGQTENSDRGHFVIQTLAADTSKYVECHFATGTGADAVFRCRVDGGALKEFSAGTATVNLDRIILRDENDDATQDFFFDRFEIKDTDFPGRGPLVPPGPPDEPWITNALPLRIHYVDDIACGGVGTIGDPECPGTAFSASHYQCGDLHILRAGNYLNTFDFHPEFSRDCTESNPAVFKGYVDPATGQPENAKFRPQIQQPGEWNWFVNLHVDGEEDTSLELSAFRFDDTGNRLINSVVHDTRGSVVRWFSNGSSPSMVLYGNVIYGAGPGTNGAHNVYTQNDCAASGLKYFVHNIDLEPRSAAGGRRIFQANDSSGSTGVCGYHLEGNLFGDAPGENGNTVIWTTGSSTLTAADINLVDNYFVDHYHSASLLESVRMGAGLPVQTRITGNYFAKTNIAFSGYWGNAGAHDPLVFTGNQIYAPPGGNHINLITKGTSGADGSHKFLDADNWDNNTYGGTFRVGTLRCNGGTTSNLSLATWRTSTDACRVTPASAVGFDINSTNPANPTVNKIEVIQNQYQCPNCVFQDGDWGLVYIVNWENASGDDVDISSVVGPNKDYTVRYPRDFFGTPAATGTCPGSGACTASLPTKETSAGAAGKFTNAYVITAEP